MKRNGQLQRAGMPSATGTAKRPARAVARHGAKYSAEPLAVRSLRTVGGKRTDVSTKKRNRRAQRAGFASWQDLVAALAKRAALGGRAF